MAFNFAKGFQLPKDFNVDFQKLSTNISSTVQGSFKEISKDVRGFSDNLQPYTKNALSLVRERIGVVDDVSKLPPDYLLLEKKVDTLRNVYKKLLEVTQTYEIESYDYPPNIKESFSDLSKTFSEKFQELSSASTTKEAEKILAKPGTNQLPKTLAHAISKAALASRESLLKQVKQKDAVAATQQNEAAAAAGATKAASEEEEDEEEDEEDSFAKVLLKLADSQRALGDKRLEQDGLIINKFNAKLQEALQKNFKETSLNRKSVENSRHRFDQTRYEIKIAQQELERLSKDETLEKEAREAELGKHQKYIEDLNNKLEAAEDDLVNKTTIAVKSMKKFLNPAESVNLIKIFTTIQLNYYKAAVKDLEGLLKDIEEIPVEEDDDEEDDEEEDDDDDDNENEGEAPASTAK